MATEEEKKAAQAQRDAIAVETLAKEKAAGEEQKEEVVETKEEGDTEEVSEEKEAEEVKEEIEAKGEEIGELKDELKEAKTEKDKERIQRRIDRLTKEKSDLKAENENLKRQLAAKPDDEKVLTEDEVERRSDEKAQQKLLDKQFADDCDKLAKEATKVDKDFQKKVDLMGEEVGKIPGYMIGVLADLDNGGAVLSYLTNNLDDAEEIYKLSPARMALRLSKISETLSAKTKKEISKVPPVKEKVGGKGQTPDVLTENMSMEDFARVRAKQVEERRKLRLGLH